MNDMFSIIGLILEIIGTAIMVKGLLMDDETIDRISGTYWDENRYLKQKLKDDRKEAIAGLIIICAGFVLQLLNEGITFIT